jgi:PmbA protein
VSFARSTNVGLADPKNDLDTALRLLDEARHAGADAADAIVVAQSAVSIGVAGGELEEAERSESREAGLRVLVGRRQACVASSDLRSEMLAELAARAVALAREAPEDPWCGLADPDLVAAGIAADALELADPGPPALPEQLEAMALEAEAAALDVRGVAQVDQAGASWSEGTVTLAATNGFSGSYRRTDTGVGVSAIAGTGLGRERDYAGETRRRRADLPSPAWIGARAGRRAAERLEPRRPPGGAVPVLFDERVAGSLIGHLLSAANGASVARGSSWLLGRMDQPVLPDGVDLVEDPLIARGPASRPFDAEGIAARAQALVQDGRLVRWILDCASARRLGLSTTGNARRGTTAPPTPGTTNVRMTQGAHARDELIAEMGTGLVVTSMIGASINPTTGAYSRGAAGFWVENGEIAYPVNEITIAGALPEMLRTVRAANDADPNRAVSAPSLLVEGLTVGA